MEKNSKGGKKTTPKKPSQPASGKKIKKGGAGNRKSPDHRPGSTGSSFVKAVAGIALLVLIVVGAAVVVHKVFPPEKQAGKHHEKKTEKFKNETVTVTGNKVEPSSIPDNKVIHVRPEKKEGDLPDVALIIDDMGFNPEMARKLALLSTNLTFSIMPYSSHKDVIATEAHNKGIEIMLHLPMEPLGYPMMDPGPGALFSKMDADTLIDKLNKDLDDVPYIIGVNNHMGSKLTLEADKMNQVFTILKKRSLFFIDSKTAPKTACRSSARLMQIPFGQRDVFLDDDENPDVIRRQIMTLIRVAEKHRRAIGIGHPRKTTYEVLKEEFPYLEQKVRLVHASELVEVLE